MLGLEIAERVDQVLNKHLPSVLLDHVGVGYIAFQDLVRDSVDFVLHPLLGKRCRLSLKVRGIDVILSLQLDVHRHTLEVLWYFAESTLVVDLVNEDEVGVVDVL